MHRHAACGVDTLTLLSGLSCVCYVIVVVVAIVGVLLLHVDFADT